MFQEALSRRKQEDEDEVPDNIADVAGEAEYMSKEQLESRIRAVRKQMEAAAKDLDFIEAARLRDEMYVLQGALKR